jgi:hypothetical protein
MVLHPRTLDGGRAMFNLLFHGGRLQAGVRLMAGLQYDLKIMLGG